MNIPALCSMLLFCGKGELSLRGRPRVLSFPLITAEDKSLTSSKKKIDSIRQKLTKLVAIQVLPSENEKSLAKLQGCGRCVTGVDGFEPKSGLRHLRARARMGKKMSKKSWNNRKNSSTKLARNERRAFCQPSLRHLHRLLERSKGCSRS